MVKKLLRAVFSFVGVTTGFATYLYVSVIMDRLYNVSRLVEVAVFAALTLGMGVLFFFLTPYFIKVGQKIIVKIEKESASVGTLDMLVSLGGIIIGLIVAYFISSFVTQIPVIGSAISAVIYVFLGILGYRMSTRRKDDIFSIASSLKISQHKDKAGKKVVSGVPKVLDTSVIIDGRIADIAKTGFIEGKFIVPTFVLEELRHIADSSDDLKRIKGRRGLDILNIMQEELKLDFEISDMDFEDISEVDMKLLKLAQTLNGKVLTNDFNLNKVAQFQGVKVLNINELANAVKTVVIPGEEMVVVIVKEGKEHNQGVAYLDDGTMIVVENAKKLIGQQFTVIVTTVLQTAAGRMIFAKIKQ
ncbi:MAG: PIN domain-containing protein [Proteocatella sp.]|nr:PIN domain-containing protein [Proteocatella sp.]